MRRTMLAAPAVTVLLLAAAACGDDDDNDADSTTTTEASSTTGADGESTTTAPTSELAAGPSYAEDGPSGSGCTPGHEDTLGTGWWAGRITAVHESSSFELDLVCWFQGSAAFEPAEADDQEVTDDYYVRDENPRTFRVEMPPGMTPATCVGDDNEPFACQANDVLTLYRETSDESPTSMLGDTSLTAFPYVWVHTDDDVGDYLFMQFTP